MTGSADSAGLTPGQIAHLATDAGTLSESVQMARLLLGTEATHDPDGKSVDDFLFDAYEKSRRLYRLLLAAAPPDIEVADTPAAAIPLEQLDTPDTRHLLSLLEKAQEVAERIDAARGRSLGENIELLPGESKGTDLAEAISEIALRVRTEVHGPAGHDGRE
jgi:hypothetical protein